MDVGYLVKAMLLGLSAGIMPGSFQAFLINQAAVYSWKRATLASLAPLLSDGPIVAATVLLLAYVPSWGLSLLQIAGGLFMLFLAYDAVKRLLSKSDSNTSAAPSGFWAAVFINFLNPNVYIYWATVSGPLFITGWRQSAWWGALFLLVFYVTMLLASNAVIAVIAGLRTLGSVIQRTLRYISVGLMVLMAALQLIAGIGGLLGS